MIPEVPVVGGEGGNPSYVGGYPEKIHIEGYLRGSNAKTEIDKLGAIRQGGLPCSYTFTAFSVTLVNGIYLIDSLSYWPEPATPNDVDALFLRFILELIEAE